MTPRVFAVLVCLIASSRWSRLRYVAAALACEAISGELSSVAYAAEMTTAAMLAWLAPPFAMASIGALIASCSQWFVALLIVSQCLAYAFAGAHAPSVAWVAMLSCAVSGARLARDTLPRDVERTAALALLVGNVATFGLMLLVGVDRAYENEIVLTSNQITHLAVSAIVLWAMRR